MYTKHETLKIKGIAILLLLFHHMYLSAEFCQMVSVRFPVSYETAARFAYCLRICVYIFSILTAYGLSLQLKDILENRGSTMKFLVYRYLKAMGPYWFLLVCFWLFCALNPAIAFGYPQGLSWKSAPYMASDFFSVSELLGRGQFMFGGHWYMNYLVAEILLLPLIYPLAKKFGWALIPMTALLYAALPVICKSAQGGEYRQYLFSIEVGILLEQNNTLPALKEKFEKWHPAGKIAGGLALLLLSVALPWISQYRLTLDALGIRPMLWTLGGMCMILFSFLCVRWKFLEAILAFFGTYSAAMFLIHSFVLEHYHVLFFRYNSPIVQYPLFVCFNLMIALVLSLARKWLRYDALTGRICAPFRQTFPQKTEALQQHFGTPT